MRKSFLRDIWSVWHRHLGAMIALALLSVALGSGMAFAFAEKSPAISRDQINALITEWSEAYALEAGWETQGLAPDSCLKDIPGYESIQPVQPGETTKEEALALAIEAVCEMRGIGDIDYFRRLRPSFGFTFDRIWVISLLPLDARNEPEWGYWVSIDAKTGELYDYRQAEPKGPEDAEAYSVLGTYVMKTVYVAPEVSASFERHAQQMDGSIMTIHEDELVMTYKIDNAGRLDHYSVRPPRYLVEALTEASRQEMFDRWMIEDERFKLPYDTKIHIQNAEYGWDELFEFFLLGDQVYKIHIQYGYKEESQWLVLYIYELTRVV